MQRFVEMNDANYIYKLYAENAEQASPIQQTYDKFMELHMDLMNAHDEMRQFMESDEFKFATNNDWMGLEDEDAEMIPSDFQSYKHSLFG